jgi:hypothetical protein
MSATPDNTLADHELIADLQRQLSECKAERDEALKRETATAEVLEVINSSPGNLALVFDAILEKALRVCSATFGTMLSQDNGRLTPLAARGIPAAYKNWRLEHPLENPLMLQRVLAGEAEELDAPVNIDIAHLPHDPLGVSVGPYPRVKDAAIAVPFNRSATVG